ncbi:MAG TPA: ATP-binding protein [Acidobacteriaceae bacterium]|jgi:anti-sigma regulatory factor (Ser/Thr protein kinase)/CheY-like chemotaxis protein|nr:ATP-binding protein [Acidobacteriaceae bacterium]
MTNPESDGDNPKSVPVHKCVLVIGRDAQVAEIVANALPDWELVCTENNETALPLLRSRLLHLVLTGDETSGQQDVELLRQIRRVQPHLRLIILTSESTPADVIESMKERAFSYFSAPYTTEALTDMLRHATEAPVWDEGIELLSATPEWLGLVARCDMRTADRLVQFIHEFSDLEETHRYAVGTAFREMLLNAMEHGGNLNPSQHVAISYVRARDAVICRIKDPGKGFSLEQLKESALSDPLDDPLKHMEYRKAQGMRAGGYGILLAKSLVDDLIYNEDGNEVLLIKYVGRRVSETLP